MRQGFTPLFDVPVKIQNPEQSLGTHVFTAMVSQSDGASIRWTVDVIAGEFSRTRSAKVPTLHQLRYLIKPTMLSIASKYGSD